MNLYLFIGGAILIIGDGLFVWFLYCLARQVAIDYSNNL
jgi:hypothetical protein